MGEICGDFSFDIAVRICSAVLAVSNDSADPRCTRDIAVNRAVGDSEPAGTGDSADLIAGGAD